MVCFKIQAIIQGYHHNKGICDAKFGKQLKCQRDTNWELAAAIEVDDTDCAKGPRGSVGCSFPS